MKFKKDKKGAIGIILMFAVFLIVLICGFILSIAIGIIDFASDEITPVMSGLGIIGETNFSEVSDYTFEPLNNLVQTLPWVAGLVYVLALFSSVIFALSYNYNPNPIFIGLYVAFILLLIFGSVILSNMYQDIYSGGDEIATRMQEQTLLSFMILYSPFIMTLIAFITGIYLFSGNQREAGGFGV